MRVGAAARDPEVVNTAAKPDSARLAQRDLESWSGDLGFGLAVLAASPFWNSSLGGEESAIYSLHGLEKCLSSDGR